MRYFPCLLACFIAAGAALAQTGSPQAIAAVAEKKLKPQAVVVRVSSTGEVIEVRAAADIPADIRRVLEGAVKAWRFSPHLQQGQPVAWATRLHLGLSAVPQAGQQFRLRVDSVKQSNFDVVKLAPPRYPREMIRAGVGSVICTELRISAAGEVQPLATFHLDGRPTEKGDPFAKAVRVNVREWKAEPLVVDGVAYPAETVSRQVTTFQAGPAFTPPRKPPLPPPPPMVECPPAQTPSGESLKLLVDHTGELL